MYCSHGLTSAHGYSCPGRPGPAWPALGARARQRMVTTPEPVQRAQRGVELDGSSAAKTLNW
jgi:hypothetical protein